MIAMSSPPDSPREVLARLCAERGEDFAGLSRLIGRNAAYIQQFIRRGTPRRLPERERAILARHFGIPEQWLGAAGASPPRDALFAPAAIEGAEGDDVRLGFPRAWLDELGSDPACLRLALVDGEAMAPTLQGGDSLLVDLGDAAGRLRDGLYLLDMDGTKQVRRLTLHPIRRMVTVQADNPAHADWPGLDPDELKIVGRVVWTGRRLR